MVTVIEAPKRLHWKPIFLTRRSTHVVTSIAKGLFTVLVLKNFAVRTKVEEIALDFNTTERLRQTAFVHVSRNRVMYGYKWGVRLADIVTGRLELKEQIAACSVCVERNALEIVGIVRTAWTFLTSGQSQSPEEKKYAGSKSRHFASEIAGEDASQWKI